MKGYEMNRSKRSTLIAFAAGAIAVLAFSGGMVLSASGVEPVQLGTNGVRPEAAGVNEGTKEQASAIRMRPVEADDGTDAVSEADKAGGCVPDYGRGKVCLPPTPPQAVAMGMSAEQMPYTCVDVRLVLGSSTAGIALNERNVDPLGLDTNRDGVACGPGDPKV